MQEYFQSEIEESTNLEGVKLNDIKKIEQDLEMEKRKIKNQEIRLKKLEKKIYQKQEDLKKKKDKLQR